MTFTNQICLLHLKLGKTKTYKRPDKDRTSVTQPGPQLTYLGEAETQVALLSARTKCYKAVKLLLNISNTPGGNAMESSLLVSKLMTGTKTHASTQ